MKYLIAFLLLFSFHLDSKAADTFITKFINSIYTQVIDSGQSNYTLFEKGASPKEYAAQEINFSSSELFGISKRAKKDFKEAIQKDRDSINWNNYGLRNVKIIDDSHFFCKFFQVLNITINTPDSILKKPIQRCEIRVHIKPGLSKKEIDSVDNKAIDAYDNQPGIVKNCYFFSKPVFSKDGKYALISVDTFYGGKICVFKLKKDKWVKILEFGFYNI